MTYEYLCTACGHAWEAEQSISEAPLKTCPSCRAEAAKRQVSGGAGFILKGGGWYADLYSSSKSEKKAEGADSKKSSSSDSAADGAKSGSGSSGSSGSSTGSGDSSSSSTSKATPAAAS
ncbi:MAG: FmdB family zinc ribbon protein [Myxococcota bacterium]